MLDAYIIEELKKQQQEELAREAERPRLEIPEYPSYIPYIPSTEDKPVGGVIIIET
jgi:hypothetical protein